MSKTTKILILLATLFPIVLFIGAYVGLFISLFAAGAFADSAEPPIAPFFIFFGMFGLAMLFWLGLLIYYIIHAVTANNVPKDMKPIWIVLFFFGQLPAKVVYWYFYIWKEPAREKPLDVTQSIG